MFSAIVPGLRDLRPALTAGSLLLIAMYLFLVGSSDEIAGRWEGSEGLQDLDQVLGPTGWLSVATVFAYLVGSVFMNARDRFERWSTAHLAQTVTATSYLDQPQSRFMRVFAPFSRPSLRRLGIVRSEQFDQQIAYQLCIDVIFGGGKRLLVASPALYDEYDRLHSEASFRDAAAIPGLLAIAALARELHYSWTTTVIVLGLGLALSALLFINARQLSREARSMYAHAVCDGSVSTNTLDDGPERSGRRRWRVDSADPERIDV